jgi:NADPH2:quinone reductase
VGQRVWLTLAQHQRPFGTAAEFTTVPADLVFPLPDDCSFDLGAAMGVPAITAHRALTSIQSGPTRLRPGAMAGTTVLVAGGAGAVGNAAIQLASWAGATVITTVSSDFKAGLASAAGAPHVLNYRTDDVVSKVREIAPAGVDLIVEVAPAANHALDLDATKDNATIAIYANEGGDELELGVRANMSKNLNYQFLILYTMPSALISTAGASVTAAMRDGALRVGDDSGLPVHYFELGDTAAAHDAVEHGTTIGKVLLRTGYEGD